MSLKATCPKNKRHKRFLTTAHEMHEWVVDSAGDFIEDNAALETTHRPNIGNLWTCEICGAEATVKEIQD